MAGSTFGTLFRVTTAGESHGPGNVVIVDGCPSGLELSEADLSVDLERRRPGQSKVVTQRQESDVPEILSGVFGGKTTGAPIAVLIRNADAKSKDYGNLESVYRPGHADYTLDARFGFRDHRGGGRSSARETTARVAAGAIAKKLLSALFGTDVVGYVVQIGDLRAAIHGPVRLEDVESLPDGSPNIVRCPDHALVPKMIDLIQAMRKAQDSIGGVAEVTARAVPAGLGEPVFDKLKADLAKALFSLPAVLGVEYGIGFDCARLRGSENNDLMYPDVSAAHALPRRAGAPAVHFASNRHGGMLGGISSGEPIVLRAAVKPTSSLPRAQPTIDSAGREAEVQTKGRHDPCLLPRFVPMAEAMVALVLADHALRARAARL